MSTGWNDTARARMPASIINLLGNEYWLERIDHTGLGFSNDKPTGK